MYWSPGFACWSLILVLAASTTDAAHCHTTFDNRCLSWPTTTLRSVDCQTVFDERCLASHATDAEIEADALAAQRRLEARLLILDVAPATVIVVRAPVRWVSPHWRRPRGREDAAHEEIFH